jgi:DNA-binding CsgD family transcriptional regulator
MRFSWRRKGTGMGVEETALELIGLTYDATLAPEKWPAFMTRLVKALGARSALLREVDHDTGNVRLFETVGYDPAFVAAYREHFVHLDYFNPALLSMPIGVVMKGNEAVPWERQHNTEFCNDYLLAQNIRHVMGCFLARDDHHHLLFALQREQGQGDFDDEDLRLVRLVTPHMARAVQIQRQMNAVTSQKHWAWSALDRLRVGVILLDERGRPVHLNRAAERLVAGRHGFASRRDGLILSSATETTHLRHLIATAAGLATGRGKAAGGCLRATGNVATTLQFQVIPLPRGLSEQPWEPSQPGSCVAVFVSASGGPRLPWSRLAAMHGLTRAEARLASLLADGRSLEEAAETLTVSIQTVRSQLKSVFAKTGVKRQAELVALLLADMLSDQTDGLVQ